MSDLEGVTSQELSAGGPRRSKGRPAGGSAAGGNSGLKAPATSSDAQIADLKQQLQEQRRRVTLQEADLHQLREREEDLEFQLLKARSELQQKQSELAASRERRKEMARVIARRDAELQVRYKELAALELHILRRNPLWAVGDAVRRLARGLRKRLGTTARS